MFSRRSLRQKLVWITENIAHVDHTARQTAEDAGRTRAAGSILASLSERLQSMIRQFRV